MRHPLHRSHVLALACLLAVGCQSSPAPTPRPSPTSTSPGVSSPPAASASAPSGSSATATATQGSSGPAGTIVFSFGKEENHDIYRVRLDSERPVQLTDGPEKEFDGALSPDGRAIAYRKNPTATKEEADIWVMGIDGSGQRNLTNAPELFNWAPVWTPDGRIAFSSAREDKLMELWTMNPDGSDVRKVADGWCEYADPSPDGKQFVCSGPPLERSTYDLWIIDTATGKRRQLTSARETEFGAAWSPDGQWIAFGRDMGDRWSLREIHPDGTGEREIATEGVFPTWAPDGRIAWSGPGGINVANADGSGRANLPYAADFLSWGP